MSTNSAEAGTVRTAETMVAKTSRRGSGTATTPTFGSIVQKGKLAACALPPSQSALKSVDLPVGWWVGGGLWGLEWAFQALVLGVQNGRFKR
jgi:hypothetical protein